MATVKIPGIGPVDKKWIYVGGAFAVGIVGYAYWNKSRADSAETEVADFTEGPGYAMDSGVDEYVNPGGSQTPVEQDYNPAPSNNFEWGQAAIAFLDDHGFEGGALAVGLYMTRQPLSSTQANMIRAAHGALGPPPSGSYPITSTPDAPPADTSVGAVSGFRVTNVYRDKVRVEWNKTPNAIGYLLYKSGQSSATAHALDTDAFIYFLKPNTSYTLSIEAVGPGLKKGPRSKITTKTKK